MVYITVPQAPEYRQMTLEELLFQDDIRPVRIHDHCANTKTYEVPRVSDHFSRDVMVGELIDALHAFNVSTERLRAVPRQSLYHSFSIPKRSGGLRRIDAPNPELMTALRNLSTLFFTDFRALYHTSAFAYVSHRSTIDAVRRHQQNGSRWFAKFDMSNFFGSITPGFLFSMLSMIFPFNLVVQWRTGEQELKTALDLAFLNGGLPQGTPISPMLTNLLMIPIDFTLNKALQDFGGNHFVYTRYADDMLISCKYNFDFRAVEGLIEETIAKFHAPLTLNKSKTRYGSSSGRNWNLGVMLNKDNEITVGYRRKKRLQSMLHNFVAASASTTPWELGDIRSLQGELSYCRMVERENIDAIIRHFNEKEGVNVMRMIRDSLR